MKILLMGMGPYEKRNLRCLEREEKPEATRPPCTAGSAILSVCRTLWSWKTLAQHTLQVCSREGGCDLKNVHSAHSANPCHQSSGWSPSVKWGCATPVTLKGLASWRRGNRCKVQEVLEHAGRGSSGQGRLARQGPALKREYVGPLTVFLPDGRGWIQRARRIQAAHAVDWRPPSDTVKSTTSAMDPVSQVQPQEPNTKDESKAKIKPLTVKVWYGFGCRNLRVCFGLQLLVLSVVNMWLRHAAVLWSRHVVAK